MPFVLSRESELELLNFLIVIFMQDFFLNTLNMKTSFKYTTCSQPFVVVITLQLIVSFHRGCFEVAAGEILEGFSTAGTENKFGLVSQNPNDIKFFLYRNPEDEDERHEIIFKDKSSLESSGYNKSLPLVLLLHGVLSNSLTLSDVQQVKNAYLEVKFPANIIMVDYGALTVSKLPFLLSTFSFMTILLGHANTELVGARVTEFIIFLMDSGVLVDGPAATHIIGFSLGAHIGGAVGKYVFNRTDKKIKRITGLDPSPQYPTSEKISPTDADFVDVTLTSLGMIARLTTEGQVQWFINGGGPHQANCPNFAPFTETYCSHTTAPFYFAKSIKRKYKIKGCPCDITCKKVPKHCAEPAVYGQYALDTVIGNYYVETS